jgi:hypothetical protein
MMVQLAALYGCRFKVLRELLINNIPDIYCVMRLGMSKSARTLTRTDNLVQDWCWCPM